jgi:hypothetical protein
MLENRDCDHGDGWPAVVPAATASGFDVLQATSLLTNKAMSACGWKIR